MFADQLELDEFNVYKVHEDRFADEMMLLTHGGYRDGMGMASLGAMVYFYGPHTLPITFDEACKVIRDDKGRLSVGSVASPSASVWNYELQKLKDEQFAEVLKACVLRMGGNKTPWDWWEAKVNSTNLKALSVALAEQKCTYDKIHYLCCRAWLDKKSPPKPFGGVKALVMQNWPPSWL